MFKNSRYSKLLILCCCHSRVTCREVRQASTVSITMIFIISYDDLEHAA